MAVEAREHPELDEELEAVADAEDELSLADEAGELGEEPLVRAGDAGVEDPVGPGLGRPQVVAVEEAAGQVQEVVVVEPFRPAEEFADVDDVHLIEARKPAGVGHLHFAVRAVSRGDDRPDLSLPLLSTLFRDLVSRFCF